MELLDKIFDKTTVIETSAGIGGAIAYFASRSDFPNSTMNQKGKTVGVVGDYLEPDISVNPELKKKCENNDLDVKKIIKRIFEDLGITEEDFAEYSHQNRNEILDFIDESIDNYISLRNKYGISDDIDREKYVACRANNYRDAKKYGLVESEKEFDKMTGDVNARLGKDYSKLSDDEKYEVIDRVYDDFEHECSILKKKALKNCTTDEEREKVEARFQRRREIAEQQRIMDFMAVNGAKEMPRAMRLGNGQRLNANVTSGMQVLSTECRTEAANSVTNDELMKSVEVFNNRGEMPSEEVLGETVHTLVSEKSYEAAKQFEQDNAEYRQKVENGEIDAPYLTKKHLNKITTAIGAGISVNVNMTESQKTEILKSWEEHVSNLNPQDAKEIKQAYETFISDYIKKNPEAATKVESIKKLIQTKSENENNTCSNITEINTGNNVVSDAKTESAGYLRNEVLTENSAYTTSYEQMPDVITEPIKAGKEQLAIALKSMPYDEVVKNFPNNTYLDLVRAIFDEGLKQYLPKTVTFLEANNADKIYAASKGCSSVTLCFILRHLSPSEAGAYFELMKDNVCHAAEKLGENIVEGQQNGNS